MLGGGDGVPFKRLFQSQWGDQLPINQGVMKVASPEISRSIPLALREEGASGDGSREGKTVPISLKREEGLTAP